MPAFLVTLTLYLLINLVLLVVGSAVGFLLHWIIPAVDVGTAILIGVVTTGLSIHFFVKLTASFGAFDMDAEEEEGRPITLYTIGSSRSRRKRRKS